MSKKVTFGCSAIVKAKKFIPSKLYSIDSICPFHRTLADPIDLAPPSRRGLSALPSLSRNSKALRCRRSLRKRVRFATNFATFRSQVCVALFGAGEFGPWYDGATGTANL